MPQKGFVTIDSVKHPAVQAARALSTPAGRARQRRYLIEGEKQVDRALDGSAQVEAIFLSDSLPETALARWQQRLTVAQRTAYLIRRGLLFKIIGTPYETSVNAVAVVRQPEVEESAWNLEAGGCWVVGEAIQDPRNVGVLVRTADAAGARGLVLSDDSGDPFSRSAVRSSTGSILSLPVVVRPDLPAWLAERKRQGWPIVATSAQARRSLWSVDLTGPCAVLLGNETIGLSASLRELADVEVAIPMAGSAHSLNVAVAAGIVLFERVRQLRALGPDLPQPCELASGDREVGPT